jgi:hypothetical protein
MQRWIRRAVGVAALGGGLLALTGTAHADERSTATQVARTPAAHAGVATVQVDLCIRLGRCGPTGSTSTARPAPGSGRLLRLEARAQAPGSGDGSARVDATATSHTRRPDRRQRPAPSRRPARIAIGSTSTADRAAVQGGDVTPSAPVTVCGNAVGRGTGSCQPSSGGSGTGSTSSGTSPSVPMTACGNAVGLLGGASASCGSRQLDTATPAANAPPAGTTLRGGTIPSDGDPGSTPLGDPGAGGGESLGVSDFGIVPIGSGRALTSFALDRGGLGLSGAQGRLAFTGTTSDALAAVALGLLLVGTVLLRGAHRPC